MRARITITVDTLELEPGVEANPKGVVLGTGMGLRGAMVASRGCEPDVYSVELYRDGDPPVLLAEATAGQIAQAALLGDVIMGKLVR